MTEPDSESENPFEFERSQTEDDSVGTTLNIEDNRFFELSDDELGRIERVADALAEYEREAAERERAATERAKAVQAEEAARAKRVFLERIGEKYLPYAGFLIFGFTTLVFGITRILQYTDLRLWLGSGLLSLGLLLLIGLLLIADWERIQQFL